MQRERKIVSTREMIKEFEQTSGTFNWDGISDAFENVRNLVNGENSLVSAQVYENYRHVKVRVLSRVGVVSAIKPWAFFCLTAGLMESPRWIYLPGFNENPVTELDSVVDSLRGSLHDGVENLPMNAKAEKVLKTFINRIAQMERKLLSRKKQRAMEEMSLTCDGRNEFNVRWKK